MFKTKIAEDNWKTKYRFGDESPLQTCERVARALASVEKNPEEWYPKFLNTLVRFDNDGKPAGFKCTTGGRITANIGTSFKKATLINCFINGPVSGASIKYNRKSEDGSIFYPVEYKTDESPDDLINIFLTIAEQAKTLASEGGYGINFDFIRPRGSLIKGTGIKHPGVVAYMKIWDSVSDCIVQGDTDGYINKIKNYIKDEDKFQALKTTVKTMIRKGAMLGSLSCEHPDCEEFVRAKQLPGMLTKFNISVVLTDDFMRAVEADDFYNQSFNGVVYKRIKARDLYDLIMESCYNRAEPGVLFCDNMMKNNPVAYLGKPLASNPCIRKGTLVSTVCGLKKVEEITKEDKLQTTLGFESPNNIEIHENEDIYRVTFFDGSFLDVSKGHIFHTQESEKDNRKKWNVDKRLLDLSLGCYVRKEPYKFISGTRLDLTRDIGLFVGLFLGDGHIDANNKVCISVDKREDSSFIAELANRLGFANWIDDSSEENSRKIVIGGKGTNKSIDLLKDIGLNIELKSFEKTFPFWWINTNNAFLAGLLDGLLSSDGNINNKGRYPQIRFKNSSLSLHIMLRHLMLYFKADYKIYKGEKAGEEHYIGDRKIIRKHDIFEGVVDNDSISNIFNSIGFISHVKKNSVLKEIIKLTSLNGVKWKTKIKSIEFIGKDTVYDFYAPEADDWNTCGIINRGCGEVPGLQSITTVCLLGSPNLTKYVKINDEKSYFDFKEYEEDIKVFFRMLDNVNDLTYAPLPAYQYVIENLRQIGMGINGLGSTLMMLGIPYSSPEALDFTKIICETKENLTWQVSALLAKEKGTFKAYDKEKFESTEYFKSDRISEETKDLIRKYGVRNAKTTTSPPLGNSSIICDNVSNAIEPVFLIEYERKNICQKWPEGLNQDNVREKLTYKKGKDFEYWQGSYNGCEYYYEPHNRGLCEVNVIRDYGYQWLLDNFPNKDHSPYLLTTKDLKIEDHLAIQEIVQYYNNQSTSKTANLPNKYPFEDFKNLYIKAWKMGLNGFTTYREGSMESVLSSISSNRADNKIIRKDIKLPKEFLNGATQIVKREGKKFYLHFSYLPEDINHEFPICLWIYTNAKYGEDELKVCNKASRNLAALASSAGVDKRIVEDVLTKSKTDYPHNRMGRMVSMCLRHNIPIQDVLVSLMNIDGDNISTLVSAIRKFLSRKLSDGIKLEGIKCSECGGTLAMESGCSKCLDCSASRCG